MKITQEPGTITIREVYADDDATAFRTLNEEWITRLFVLESRDRETLDDPKTTILAKGGRIFFADEQEEGRAKTIGCVALIAMGDGVYELSKMAVSPSMRGRGIGRRLLERVIAEARAMGARSLFLGSSTRLPDAIHLYEASGFQHIPPERLASSPYTRADVFMELAL